MTASFSPVLEREPLRYGLSSALSVIFHLGIVALLIVTFVDETPVKVPPAAIMLSFAEQIQVSQPKAILPLGVNQQQKAEASAAEQTPQKEEVARILAAETGEFAEKNPQKVTKVTPKHIDAKKQNTLKQQAIQGNATLTKSIILCVICVLFSRRAVFLPQNCVWLTFSLRRLLLKLYRRH
ncbi:hypothetical protein [Klebsiella sp. BIGb0407]|uniref:hypothetical protein n=1 Tax=Klebsiella sp. BIGb0407 TaxID=2940603 RepID=UPI002166F482|nr:hypothetical protein [Klebsiella sp. BIGb0407]MCS3431796.1 hypothetical protein [Klebsiella sp. BIGb0407]